MNTTVPEPMGKVKMASRSVRRFFIFIFVVVIVGAVAPLFGESPEDIGIPISLVGVSFSGELATEKIRMLRVINVIVSAVIVLKILFHLIKLFGLYADGRIFTVANVKQIRQLGITMMLLSVLWISVFVAALPDIAAQGQQWIKVMPTFPMDQLIGGAIIVLFSWIMDVGRELREEHDLVV